MVRSFVATVRVEFLRTCTAVQTEFLRTYGRPSDSFSSLRADFTLTVQINALDSI